MKYTGYAIDNKIQVYTQVVRFQRTSINDCVWSHRNAHNGKQ